MKRFVTSNLQLGRPSAIEKYNRPFKDVDQMTETLISNWNRVVSAGDLVYHLGNFAWDPKTAQSAINQLNGTIWFLPGEIDAPLLELKEKGMLVKNSTVKEPIMPLEKMKATISYWPLKEWPRKSDGFWSLIGYPGTEHRSDPKQRVINVSTDLWNFKPQELEHILGIFHDL
jgi:calcineurin-like phosphoesterase family protein